MPLPTRKTLFTDINDRTERDAQEGDLGLCLALLLKLEFLVKIVTAGVVACLEDDLDRSRYTLERRLVRANSLGDWSNVLNEALVGSAAQAMRPDARELRKDLTERVGPEDWRRKAVAKLAEAASSLGADVQVGKKESLRRFFEVAVQLRNRTRGHGAPRSDQCGVACSPLHSALTMVEQNCRLLQAPWAYLRQNYSGKYRVTPLLGEDTAFDDLKRDADTVRLPEGVYLRLKSQNGSLASIRLRLVYSDPELRDVWLPNGNYRQSTGKFELLSYSTNDDREEDGSVWLAPANRRPESETQGVRSLEALGSVFTNAPPLPTGYVSRPVLEEELSRELSDPNRHRLVTLSGRGGIGKTALALKLVRRLSETPEGPYDVVLWLSARDTDLLDTGPTPVARSVFTQRDIAEAVAETLDHPERDCQGFDPEEYLRACLRDGAQGGRTLFVLDNFETLETPIEVFEEMDAHVRPPNKVLITTRFRSFRGDFPIEVTGMTESEATELIDRRAAFLGITDLLNRDYVQNLIEQSGGHPYVIRLALGEAAVERKAVTPKGVLAGGRQVLDALFRRTFQALSPGAQRVFLLLSAWRVSVPEIAVEAVMLRRRSEHFDVGAALDEVVRFSLVERSEGRDNRTSFVTVPLVAALFGRGELEVHRLRPTVENDRRLLMDFGARSKGESYRGVEERIENLIRNVARRSSADGDVIRSEDREILEYLADQFPRMYWRLAELVTEEGETPVARELAREYLKRYIQGGTRAESGRAWDWLAHLRGTDGDAVGQVQALCEAAAVPGRSLRDLSRYANRVNNVVYSNPVMRTTPSWLADRGMLLSRLIEELEKKRGSLTATDCSRLAWLQVNAGRTERAIDIARLGADREPGNEYCRRFLERFLA